MNLIISLIELDASGNFVINNNGIINCNKIQYLKSSNNNKITIKNEFNEIFF